jgi:serine/threonine-protein kinase
VSESHEAFLEALGDRYEFREVLGVGGMGAVYKALDRKHDRDVAIKTVRPDLTTEPMRRRFQREIKITARLQHPHVLSLLDSGMVGKTLYYVMPFVKGESLEKRLRRDNRVPADEVVRIGRDVARGLHAAHQEEVIHRDIKPGNVMLTPTYALIMDFGIAKLLAGGDDDLVTAGGWLGTPAYMAPEQFEGIADARSDVYALAAVLYQALTGRNWPSPLSADPPDWTGIQPSLQQVLERALAGASDARWRDAAAFEEALERWDRERGLGTPVSAPRTGIVTRLRSAFRRRAAPAAPARSAVAVLPLKNLTREEETEYFSLGITEDIIANLSRVRGLKVISRTSVMRYRDSTASIQEIGKALNVGAVLEGSVRTSGDRIRIVSQLIDASTDQPIWSETYDRRMDDIFDIQSDVARRIADAMDAQLSTGDQYRLMAGATEDVAAYDLYLRSRLAWNRRTGDSFDRSIEYLEGAVGADPSFGLAYAGLAETYVTQGIYGLKAPHDVMPLARRAAERALEIDARQAEAVAALGSVQSLYEWDWSGAEATYRRAIDLSPNYPVAHQWYATHVLIPRGRFDEARHELEVARELDPLSPSIASSETLLDYHQGRFEIAAAGFRRIIESSPRFWLAHYFLGWSLLDTDTREGAIEAFTTAVDLSRNAVSALAGLGVARAVTDGEDEAREILAELRRRDLADEYVSPLRIAQVHAGLGEVEDAIGWLERAVEGRDLALVLTGTSQGFDSVAGESRYSDVRTKVMGPIAP